MKRLTIFLVLLSLFFDANLTAFAQTGAWIEQSITVFGSGNRIYRCGGNCVAYTHENAPKILFFDITNSSWTETNFATSQHFYSVLAGGNLIFAYSDSFIIAYNGLISHFDTVRFVGTPLHLESTPEVYRSYQCGENLAIFVTDSKLYVFDVSVNHWLEFDYTLPADYSGVGYYWVQDDCAGILLYRTNQQAPTTLAYSAHFHAFAETARGMAWGGQDAMTNGFAGLYNWVPENGQYVVGYSSLTNVFTHVDIPSDYLLEPCVFITEHYLDCQTAWEATARKVIEPFEDVRYLVNCYDTRRAAWSNAVFDFDPTTNPGFGGWILGGRFAWHTTNSDDDYRVFYYFSGYTGDIFSISSPLDGSYLSFFLIDGSDVCASNDTTNFWAYNIEARQGALAPYTLDGMRHQVGGEGYLTFSQYDYTGLAITCYYHGASNSWITLNLDNTSSSGFAGGSHVFATITTGSTAGVYFYSPISNQIYSSLFAPDTYISIRANDYLSVASSIGRTVIFDAHYDNLHEFDCSVGNYGMGENVVIASNSTTNGLSGYSSLTNSISTADLTSTPYISGAGDIVGLGYIGYNGSRYYAFNGYYANWVELIPEGSYIGQNFGDKTAVVVRSNHLYAFDPQALTAINDEDNTVLPQKLGLTQNYPNPFNSQTLINYFLPRASYATIDIFDIMGRKLETLIAGNLTAGRCEMVWDASKVSSGIYFCRIQADNETKTMKMTLLK